MKIGKIISVEYDKFRVRLFNTTRTSTVNIHGKVYYFGNIGSYMKSLNSSGDYILCEVTSIIDWVQKDAQLSNAYNLDTTREIIVKPIGTLSSDKGFCMGVGIFPALYSDVEIVTYSDLDSLLSYKDPTCDACVHKSISLGISKNLINYRIDLDINRFFNIHTAILGNSGSGKSNTIAHILHQVYRKSNNAALGAKTIIFDSNGEYPMAFGKDSNLNVQASFYKPNIQQSDEDKIYKPFHLPYYLMNLDEWLSFLMASERSQKPFWDRVLQESYKFYRIFNTDNQNDKAGFANYIKWRLVNMLLNVARRVDSDTSKMTAAKGLIGMMSNICHEALKHKAGDNDTVYSDLINFFNGCSDLCIINYGENKDSLTSALPDMFSKNEKISYWRVTLSHNRALLTSTEQTETSCFSSINEKKALDISSQKLFSGQYFDYHYLKAAVELTLLDEESKGNVHIREFTSTLMSRLDYFLYNPDCDFMRIDKPIYKDSSEYLSKLFGINDDVNRINQLISIDSSEVGTDALELMTSVVSRMIFDHRKGKLGHQRRLRPVHIILDEAHRYIRKDGSYMLRENIFEKIAREGRKYSLYLIVSSQRPSELSQTVLSQCGNYIVHRIQNEVDMKYIYSVLPYFSEDYITKIKQAVPGEALIFGNCVPMPLMVKVDEANPAPNSSNCDVRKEWFIENHNQDNNERQDSN